VTIRWKDGSFRSRCCGQRSDGSQCPKEELPEFGYCFRHAPDDLVELAEQITGNRRCHGITRALFRFTGDTKERHVAHRGHRCGNTALPGSDFCRAHLNARGDLQRYVRTRVDVRAEEELAAIQRDDAIPEEVRAASGATIGNPLVELLYLAAEMKAWKERIKKRVDEMKVEEYRYSTDKLGEQLRAEIVVYERAMVNLTGILTKIARLNIEERLMRITERQAEIIEMAITGALAEQNLPVSIQEAARKSVVRRLAIVS
jgi:hypothetical protein